jgi:hypothetical protein
LPPALKPVRQRLAKGVKATATLWPPLQSASRLVPQGAEILANAQPQTGAQVRVRYLALIKHMQEHKAALASLGEALEHFCHIPDHFAAGLFHCSGVEGFPRTTKDLEPCFGVARVPERRARGRRGAIPGVVDRGSVRLITAVVTKQQSFSAEELRPSD